MADTDHKTGPTRLLSKKQLRELIPLAYSTIWEMSRRGEFPRAIKICGSNRVAFREDEVRRWIETRPRQELKANEEVEED